MNSPLLQIIAAGLLGGFLSMAVAVLITFRLPHVWLNRMVSFSTGVLLSVALLDLMPEALEGGLPARPMFTIFLAGLVGFFLFEKGLINAHHHGGSEALVRPIPMVLVSGALHVWTDGMMLAAAFLANSALGWSMTFAVIAHEIPREGGDFSLLLAAGWSKARALTYNAVSRTACVVGGLMGYALFDTAHGFIPPVLTLAASGFIYIALANLMPWIRSTRGGFIWHGGFMGAGVLVVPMMSYLFESGMNIHR